MRLNPIFPALIVDVAGMASIRLRDYALGTRVRKRDARMMAEFPSVAELMVRAVSAGEKRQLGAGPGLPAHKGVLAREEFGLVLAFSRAGSRWWPLCCSSPPRQTRPAHPLYRRTHCRGGARAMVTLWCEQLALLCRPCVCSHT